MSPLTIERLRLLVAVGHYGTISAAARDLGYTASAVSQQLSGLERRLGVSLLERTSRGVSLTPTGLRLSQRAAKILDLVDTATAEAMEAGPEAPPLAIRIGAFPTAISLLLIPVIGALSAAVELTIVHLEPEQALAELAARHIDAALVDLYDNEPPALRPGLHHVPLLTDPLQLAVHVDAGVPGSIADLADAPWALAGAHSRLGRAARAALRTIGVEPRVTVESDDHRVVFDVMGSLTAATVQPELALRAVPAHVRPVPEIALNCDRHVQLVTRDLEHPHMGFAALEQALRNAPNAQTVHGARC